MTIARRSFLGAALGAASIAPQAWAQSGTSSYQPQVGQGGKDVVWVPTSQTLVDRMLDMAGLTPQDRLVDLGSGDGRLVITAAKRGAQARGIEYNPDMVALSRRAAEAEGVATRVRFEQADIFASDFSEATVVTLFLLPNLNMRLRPTLLNMPAGTRVMSNSFTMEDWEPDDSFNVVEGCSGYCNALKWVVPAKVGGNWQLGGERLVLTQSFQKLEGRLGAASPLAAARLDGANIRFTAGGRTYTGQVAGNSMRGTVDGAPWSATRVAG
jgi:SAM-dependent methyltransferase